MKRWLGITISTLLTIGVSTATTRTDDDEPVDVDIKTLTEIEWQEGDPLPDRIKKYDGKKVRITGLMDPNQYVPEKVTQFHLVSNTCGCSGAGVQHFISVDLGEQEIDYQTKPIDLIGKISIGEVEDDDGFVTSVYRLEVEKIEGL